MVVMGRVAGAYGVRGTVRVTPLSQDPQALTQHAQWWLRARDDAPWQAHRVSGARTHGAALIATLDGVATREDAERLRGALVGVPRSELPALAAHELYWADLEGLDVVNAEGVALGKVVGLMDNGAHPILRVRDAGAAERLIPWVPAHVTRVDVAARRIDVDWPVDA
jgi:16S rRNA processing protein RimM